MLFSHLRRRALWTLGVLAMIAGSVSLSPANASSGFGDVSSDDWFAAPVQWLVDNDITTGVSAGCFGPGAPVSRGQLATFLWRYAGEPSAPGHSFVDVNPGSYYNDAVAWLATTGVTSGTTPTTFSPEQPITRAMVAAFLWRLAGEPSAPATNFSDVPSSAYYADAVDWMVRAGITNGSSPTTFSPNRTLNRAEFAAFLYRFDGSPSVSVTEGGFCVANGQGGPFGEVVYMNDFSSVNAMNSLQTGVQHRDSYLVTDQSWPGDHVPTGGVNCSGPEERRTIQRSNPEDSIYMCHPGGNPDLGHLMTSIGDTSGYSWAWFMPDQVFNSVTEVRWDVNITDLGNRQFTEVMIIPASNWVVDPTPFDTYDSGIASLPCLQRIFQFPCVDQAPAYSDWNAIGTSSFNGDLIIATQDGREVSRSGAPASDPARTDIRERRTHFFRDNLNGTVTLGQEQADGSFLTITTQGSFPSGNVRVVFKDHNYTPNKSESGFARCAAAGVGNAFHGSGGLNDCVSYTWHWDDITVAVQDS